jgi:histidinol-phosphate aminotransferase
MATISRRDWIKTGAFAAAAAGALHTVRVDAGAPAPVPLLANENPYGPSEAARRALVAAIPAANRYSGDGAGGTDELKRLIAEREGLAPECVVLGAGSSEVLFMAALAFGLGSGEIVTADPTFGLLRLYAERVGVTVHRVPLDAKMAHDLEAMRSRVTAKTSLVYVCNPNNPTGTLLPGATVRAFCEEIATRATVLVDEAYVEYVDPKVDASAVDLVRKGANVVVARTFSKIYGLAGLRIGYALARPDLAARLSERRVGNVGKLAYEAALASLRDRDFVTTSRSRNAAARAFTVDALAKLGIRCPESHGNFVYANVGTRNRKVPVALAERGLLLTWNGRPLAGDWMRVTIGTDAEMRRFAAALKEVVA